MAYNFSNYQLSKYRLTDYNMPLIDEYTKLLLHCEGTNGSTSFIDESGKTITPVGNAQISTAQYKFGSSSALFDNNGDYLSLVDSDDWNFGNGDFTLDFWVRFNAISSTQWLFCQRYSYATQHSFALYLNSSGKLNFVYSTNGSSLLTQAFNTTLTTGTWYHVAVVRNGTTLTCYINGIAESSAMNMSTNTIYNSAVPLLIGGIADYNQSSNAYMDEIRISKGVARWTSNFTAPTAPY